MARYKNRVRPLAVAALLMLTMPIVVPAQSTTDRQQVVLAQIQLADRATVLNAMDLDDAKVGDFTRIYDAYQADYKKIMDRAVGLIDHFAARYDSLTDPAAERLLRNWFKLKNDEDHLLEAYARKMGKVLPPASVLRWVQLENRLSTELRLQVVQRIPLASHSSQGPQSQATAPSNQ